MIARPKGTLENPPRPLFLALTGFFFGLALLKFGNPVVLYKLIEAPHGVIEVLFQTWPLQWSGLLLVPILLLGFSQTQGLPKVPRFVIALPLVWLGWALLSSTRSVEPALSRPTISHFIACVLVYFLGLTVLSRYGTGLKPFWLAFAGPFLLVLWMGFDQHYGGLEATRKQFFELPNWQSFPPDYLKKIQSDRIFSTLVYPNALAGAVLLFLPATLVAGYRLFQGRPPVLLGVVLGLWTYAALACLYWSGSKSGWLIALVLCGITALHLNFSRTLKLALIVAVAVLGLVGFSLKFAGYFRKGATSVSARFDYWEAGLKTIRENPLFGTGPGTFAIPYKKLKKPDSEMARLLHNDYLEQGSDSGVLGLLAYSALIFGLLLWLYRERIQKDLVPEVFAVWLGLVAWMLQSFVEFPLYIPALAWPAFLFLGYLAGLRDVKVNVDQKQV